MTAYAHGPFRAERVLYFLIDIDSLIVAPPLIQSMHGCDGDALMRYFPLYDGPSTVLGPAWAQDESELVSMRKLFGTETDWSWYRDLWSVMRTVRARECEFDLTRDYR